MLLNISVVTGAVLLTTVIKHVLWVDPVPDHWSKAVNVSVYVPVIPTDALTDTVLVAWSHVTSMLVGLTDHVYVKVSPSGSIKTSLVDVTFVVRALTTVKSGCAWLTCGALFIVIWISKLNS